MAITTTLSPSSVPPVPLSDQEKAIQALAAQLQALQAENAKLKAKGAGGGKLTLKVSEKGALSVYGMGRWPVTLYRSQWETLLSDGTVKAIREFITANASKLAVKE